MSLLLETLKNAENLRRAKPSSTVGGVVRVAGDDHNKGEEPAVVSEPSRSELVLDLPDVVDKEARASEKNDVNLEKASLGAAAETTGFELTFESEPAKGELPAGEPVPIPSERAAPPLKSASMELEEWDFHSSWDDGFPDAIAMEEKIPESRKDGKTVAEHGEAASHVDREMDALFGEISVDSSNQEGLRQEELQLLSDAPPEKAWVGFQAIDDNSGDVGGGKGKEAPLTVADPVSFPPLEGGNNAVSTATVSLTIEETSTPPLASNREPPVVPGLAVEPVAAPPLASQPISLKKVDPALSQGGDEEPPPISPPIPPVNKAHRSMGGGALPVRLSFWGKMGRWWGSWRPAGGLASSGGGVSAPVLPKPSGTVKASGMAWSEAAKLMNARRLHEENVKRRKLLYASGAVLAVIVMVVIGYVTNYFLAPLEEETVLNKKVTTQPQMGLGASVRPGTGGGVPGNQGGVIAARGPGHQPGSNQGNMANMPMETIPATPVSAQESGSIPGKDANPGKASVATGAMSTEARPETSVVPPAGTSLQGGIALPPGNGQKEGMGQKRRGRPVGPRMENEMSVASTPAKESEPTSVKSTGAHRPKSTLDDRAAMPLFRQGSAPPPVTEGVPAAVGSLAEGRGNVPGQRVKRKDIELRNEEIIQGSVAFKRGDLDEAERLFLLVYTADKRDSRAMIGLASVALRRGDTRSAETYYRKILQSDPKNSIAMVGLSGIQGSARVEGEEGRLRQQLRETPDATHVHFTLGNMMAAQRRWSEAWVSFENASRLDRDNPEITLNLAVSLDHLRRIPEAIKTYQRALDAAGRFNKVNFSVDAVRRRIAVLQSGKL
ncbi:MAG: tetratricopeptide repeat protein [Magnetococcales bacterium]|nr:tetratricopeptide repeat protein [Magnetococcales bacterium]